MDRYKFMRIQKKASMKVIGDLHKINWYLTTGTVLSVFQQSRPEKALLF